jgi:RIO-like serine/threonine protein kinase
MKKVGLSINLSVITANPLCTPDGALRFKRRLGGGSEGEVYVAEARNGDRVAVKVFTADDAHHRLQVLKELVSPPIVL